VLGLALILIFATVVFVRGVTLAIRGRHHAVRFGVELLLVFTVLFLFSHHALRMAGVGQFIESLEKALAFLWWISLAFTLNASLNRFVWAGVLSENGVRKVPKLLTDGAALLVYGCAVMIAPRSWLPRAQPRLSSGCRHSQPCAKFLPASRLI
jgi:hypothetical protein